MPTPPPGGPHDVQEDGPQRTRAWSSYWATGALHSCAGSFAGNYQGAIRAFWERVYRRLPATARVLDLCCGNAPLAQLLLSVRNEPGIGADAVDAANVAPAWLNALPAAQQARVRIHAGVDVAALPFPDASFDLCTSQYGVEYVGEAAMAEVNRVRAPGGVFAAVLHHVEALPVRIAREENGHLAWLQAPGGLFDACAGLLRPLALAATPEGRAALQGDALANQARARFNLLQQELDQHVAAASWPDVLHEARSACGSVLEEARTRGEEAGRAALEDIRAVFAGQALRQRELAAHALDEPRLRALLAPLGGTPELSVLRFEGGEIAGWAVVV